MRRTGQERPAIRRAVSRAIISSSSVRITRAWTAPGGPMRPSVWRPCWVEHGYLRKAGTGGMHGLDPGQARGIAQRASGDERADCGEHIVVDQHRIGELRAAVHNPVTGASQVTLGLRDRAPAGRT
jgi:hypothetical protein